MLKRALHLILATVMGATLGLAAWPQEAQAAEPTVYTQPGDHFVNGRYWRTSCEKYSSTVVRCRTEIFATKVIKHGNNYYNHNGWVFNNMTYLPSDEAQWAGNPLAYNVQWSATDGRKWRTECNTAATGKGGCRSYVLISHVVSTGGTFKRQSDWVFNNMVKFTTSTLPAVKTIPARSAPVANMPVEKPFVPPKPKPAPPAVDPSFRADSRCYTGRVLCISKNQRKMAYMINGKIQDTVTVRFGSELTPTRNGNWTLFRKSRDHVSSLYGSAMPFAMFFSGGQAVHYSADFAARGYNGSSHGCVNVRDYNALKAMYESIRIGDRVVVYN